MPPATLTCPRCGVAVARPEGGSTHRVGMGELRETAECPGCATLLTRAVDPPDAGWQAP